jgi:sulfoxide reductase catalytic subunit YedY
MANIRIPRGWEIPEREATPEDVYLQRRRFMKGLGLLAIGATAACRQSDLMALGADGQSGESTPEIPLYNKGVPEDVLKLFPATRNEKFKLDRNITPEKIAATYNNFYEFTEDKPSVAAYARKFNFRPWTVEIAGLVKKPRTVDADDLIRKLQPEERLYRHRCVEAWAMAVPWTGFPMKKLVEYCEPLGSAKHVKLTSFLRPEEAPGQKKPWYQWPYYEGLRMEEATNDLALMGTGIYGHAMTGQHGAPIRLITPWKYGFKSIKSIVKIEFTAREPGTFWHTSQPREYGFLANVNPAVPHPRWSQATERLIDTGKRVPTQPFNGYGEFVAHMYKPETTIT